MWQATQAPTGALSPAVVHGATPVVANGTLYVNTSANGLVALRPPA